MMAGYYGKAEGYTKCPLKGACLYRGIQCNKEIRCTWLEYEMAVHHIKERG